MRTLLLGLLLVACTPSETLPDCTPGATVACACVGGGSGAQTCSTGRAYGACVCPDGGAADVPGVDVTIDAQGADATPDVTALDSGGVDAADAASDAATDRPPPRDVNCRNPREADRDGDGQPSITCGGRDCNDDDPLVGPSAAEFCDGIDENCDGNADEPLPDGGIDSASAQWCMTVTGSGPPGTNTRCVLPGAIPQACALVADGGCASCLDGRCGCPAARAPTCVVCSRDPGMPRDCTIFTVRNRNPDVRTSCR